MDKVQQLFQWDSTSGGSSLSDKAATVRRRSWRERRADRQRKGGPGIRRKGSTGVPQPKKKAERPMSVSKARNFKMGKVQDLFQWDSSSGGSSLSDIKATVRRRSWRERRADRQRKGGPGIRRKGSPGVPQLKKKGERPRSVSKTRTTERGKATKKKMKKKKGTKTQSNAPQAGTAVSGAVSNQLMHLFDWDEGLKDSSSSSETAVLSDMWKSVLGKTATSKRRYFMVSYSRVCLPLFVVGLRIYHALLARLYYMHVPSYGFTQSHPRHV